MREKLEKLWRAVLTETGKAGIRAGMALLKMGDEPEPEPEPEPPEEEDEPVLVGEAEAIELDMQAAAMRADLQPAKLERDLGPEPPLEGSVAARMAKARGGW